MPRSPRLPVLFLLTLPHLLAQDAETYQINFGPSPTDGQSALSTLNQRIQTVLRANACGDEFTFYGSVHTLNQGEGLAGTLVAKIQILGQSIAAGLIANPNSATPTTGLAPCTQTRLYSLADFNAKGDGNTWKSDISPTAFDAAGNLVNPALFASRFQAAVIAQFAGGLGDACTNFTASINVAADPNVIHLTYSVPMDCLRAQVNTTIMNFDQNRNGFHQPGTDGAVCWEKGGSVPGDWDVAVRDLTRIYFLNQKWRWPRLSYTLLDLKTSLYMRDGLMSIRKGPGQDAYALPSCGNSGDYYIGTPDDTANDDNWTQNAIAGAANSGGDLSWLFSRILLFLATVAIVATAGSIILVAPSGLSTILNLVATGAGAAAITAGITAIPETENHRLMIETSRYLYDRVAANEATDPGNRAKWAKYAADVREYLLKRLQSISQHDFIEYNARPYQRYSNVALLNLYDFADDPQLQTAAQMVLEYSAMKFAMAGNQGRRSVPFRRRMEVDTGVPSILEIHDGDDYQVAQMLVFAAQTQQLPQAAPIGLQGVSGGGLVSIYGLGDMVYVATSGFRPDVAVLDLAIRKDVSYYQRLSFSNAVEIYSGAPSYVVSAGGIRAPAAYPVQEIGVALPGGGNGNPFISDDDRGAAVPTSLILAAGNGDTGRDKFIRLEGNYTDFGSSGSKDHPTWRNSTFGNNACVWKGFACGLNLVMPSPAGCAMEADGSWFFIDSATCAPGSPHFYVVMRSEPCAFDNSDPACAITPGMPPASRATKGFFEAVDSPPDDFATFKAKVKSLNPQPFALGAATYGTYHSYSGHTIEFDCEAHQHDSDKWGVTRVDGVDQPPLSKWPLASGDIMNAAGDGTLDFLNPRLSRHVHFDFTKWDNPVRTMK